MLPQTSLSSSYRDMVVDMLGPALYVDETVQRGQLASQYLLPFAVVDRVHTADVGNRY